MNARVLYISYDGLLEPLGQSQVLQYLKSLAAAHDITLVSFEKAADWADVGRRDALIDEVRRAGIDWHPLRYHRSPSVPATLYDLVRGAIVCGRIVRRRRIQIVHARSYIPSVIAYLLKRLFGAAFVFDMRGFWPDERVEGGAWRRGSVVYAVVKRLERVFLSNADVIVSLTHAGERIIRGFPYMQGRASRIAVIPTCTNLALFRPGGPPATKDGPGALIVGYVGSVTTWYMFDPVLTAFEMLRRRQPSARLRIVNRGQHAYIRERLGAHAIPDEVVELREASFADMAAEMATMDCGVFFIRPVFSKQASAPTKLGEFLACGIPCLTSSGVGDVQEILEPGRVGVVTAGTEPDQLRDGVERLLRLVEDPDTRERCVAAALEHFSLESGVAAYDRIYRSLTDHLEVPAGRVAEEDETAFDVPSPPAMTH